MSSAFEKGVATLLTLAALVIAAVLLKREFFAEQTRGRAVPVAVYDDDWRQILPISRTVVGDSSNQVVIAEFSDIECPVCERFHGAVKQVEAAFPGQVTHAFVHFPLRIHRNALRAARAAECANVAGKFRESLDALFAHQSDLGDPAWPWLMSTVAVSDSATFGRCMVDSSSMPMVNAGRALGEKMKIQGTPTVFLNGWRYPAVPSDTELLRAVGDLLHGKVPYEKFPKHALRVKSN